jgi:hypothetical protein
MYQNTRYSVLAHPCIYGTWNRAKVDFAVLTYHQTIRLQDVSR